MIFRRPPVLVNITARFLFTMNESKTCANDFVNFLNKAVTPYHAVDECAGLLKASGFKELNETDVWQLKPLDKCYLTRNKSAIIAFAIGGKFKPGNGMSMVVAHTDSPCLKVKPVSKVCSADCLQVGVMCYGGGLWRTWFDRDLTVAGSVMVQGSDGQFEQKLLHVKKPIMSIPNLAIHLDRESNGKFVFNTEEHLRPILATEVTKSLGASSNNKEKTDAKAACEEHHPILLEKMAEELGVKPGNILSFDLCVIDTQPATIGGLNDEFIYGARLDNLVNTYSSIMALIESCSDEGKNQSLSDDSSIRFVACYDNEECGSQSAQGAESALTEWVLRRLQAPGSYPSMDNKETEPCCFERAIAGSFLISADQAHAQHPNYKGKHEENHAPRLHKGVVVKINPNQRYATTAFTHAFLERLALNADVPLQKFVVRNDSGCGSTVGPILSAKLGLKTVDVGSPQFAMHSIREMACTSGVYQAKKLFTAFFEKYDEMARKC